MREVGRLASNIVQLPERRFPGIVIQGDTMSSFLSRLKDAKSSPDPEERDQCLEELIESFSNLLDHYESVLEVEGYELPYARSRENR